MTLPPKDSKNPYKNAPSSMQILGQVWGISFAFVASAGAGALLGWGVDHFAHTGPIGLLVGVAIGIVAGGIRFVRDANRAEKDSVDGP